MQQSQARLGARDYLDWPFFDAEHRGFMDEVERFAGSGALDGVDLGDVDAACRRLVAELGRAGLLRVCISSEYGGFAPQIESRRLTLAREGLAYRCGLTDFALAMQGLGSGPIALEGDERLRQHVLPKVARGELIPAFALSETDAGSDVAAMSCSATRDGGDYVVSGSKTWISNGGIADVYTLFARTGEAPGTRGISAFVVYPDDPGFSIAERLQVMAPHPLATLQFDEMRIPASRMLGAPGTGFKLAMRTLDIFRVSVAGAALGFARRALDEALAHTQARQLFGEPLASKQMTQDRIGEMACLLDAAALQTYRAAWKRDVQRRPTTLEAAMAKMAATENAQKIVDGSLQLFGARGVQVGGVMESLYREVRALRIYEGATEVQKMIIARELQGAQA